MIWSSSSRFTSTRGRFIVAESPGTCDAEASPTSSSLDESVPGSVRDDPVRPWCRSPASWPRDNTCPLSATCPRTSPTSKSDARRCAANLRERSWPCAPECARPDAAPEPKTESESVCCRPADVRCARVPHRSIPAVAQLQVPWRAAPGQAGNRLPACFHQILEVLAHWLLIAEIVILLQQTVEQRFLWGAAHLLKLQRSEHAQRSVHRTIVWDHWSGQSSMGARGVTGKHLHQFGKAGGHGESMRAI
jgi:hypothetical protein